MRSRLWAVLAIPGLAWLIAFFLIAFYAIVSVGLGNINTLYVPLPHWNPLDWNVGYIWAAIKAVVPGGETWDDFVRTLAYVVVAVVLSLAIGYPVAWYAARYSGRWRGPLLVALVLPFWISYLMRMLAWINLLAPGGYAARFLAFTHISDLLYHMGLLSQPNNYLGGESFTVIFALIYGYIPYFILPLYASLDRIDRSHLEAARDLGASPFRAFWHVTLPLSKTGLLGGAVLIVLPMFGDYYTPNIVSGAPTTSMIGNQIDLYFHGGPQPTIGAAITIILSAFLVVLMGYYMWTIHKSSKELVA